MRNEKEKKNELNRGDHNNVSTCPCLPTRALMLIYAEHTIALIVAG